MINYRTVNKMATEPASRFVDVSYKRSITQAKKTNWKNKPNWGFMFTAAHYLTWATFKPWKLFFLLYMNDWQQMTSSRKRKTSPDIQPHSTLTQMRTERKAHTVFDSLNLKSTLLFCPEEQTPSLQWLISFLPVSIMQICNSGSVWGVKVAGNQPK